ncbi:MAG: VTC domain-containing protein [Deltaproteobacteria bacterium]|nr:VTC domain-containing protein [Deltaproteobacteria bacterium]
MSNPTLLEGRFERQYELGINQGKVAGFCDDVSRHIPRREFVLGQPTTYHGTIYFDTDDLLFFRQGLQNRFDHLKIRARKYEYPCPSLNGLPHYWLELKIKSGGMSRKKRVRVDIRQLEGLLTRERERELAPSPEASLTDPEGCAQIRKVFSDNKLKPLLLVMYERMAFENEQERLTVDWNIRYYQAEPAILSCPWLKDICADPVHVERTATLELKLKDNLPSWFSVLKQEYPIRYRISFGKPLRGMRALLSGPLKCRPDALTLLEMISHYEREGELLDERL